MVGVTERNSEAGTPRLRERRLHHVTIVFSRNIPPRGIRKYLSQNARGIALLTRLVDKNRFQKFRTGLSIISLEIKSRFSAQMLYIPPPPNLPSCFSVGTLGGGGNEKNLEEETGL